MVQDHIVWPLEMAFPEEPALLEFVYRAWRLGAAHTCISFSLMDVFSHSLGLFCDKGCVCLVRPGSLLGML